MEEKQGQTTIHSQPQMMQPNMQAQAANMTHTDPLHHE